MKHHLIYLSILGGLLSVSTGVSNAQPTNGNWIMTTVYTGTSVSSFNSDVKYYDGLGMPEQMVSVAASPAGKSIVTPYYRDSLFRTDARTYLPYEATYSSAEKQASPTDAARYVSIYGVDDSPYAWEGTIFDSFSANRPIASTRPGGTYHEGNVRRITEYGTNVFSDLVWRIQLDGESFWVGSNYAQGLLRKTVYENEDGVRTAVFTDKLGREILTRQYLGSGPYQYADTYTVYDDAGRVTCVISPKGSAIIGPASPVTDALIYCSFYRYDGYGRLARRRLSGKGWEFFVYDKGGRLVLSQDAVMRSSNQWLYIVYDNAGREIEKTLVSSSMSQSDIQSAYDDASFDNSYPALGGSPDYRIPLPSGFTLVKHLSSTRYGGSHYRISTSSASPTGKFPIPPNLYFSPVSGVVGYADRDTTISNLKIYERLSVLGQTITPRDAVDRAFYYDKRGRLIQTVELNALGGISRTSIKYDFCDRPLIVYETVRTSSGDTTDDVKVTEYTYDSRGRMLTETCTVNGGTAGSVTYAYDGIGQLVSRTFGNGLSESISHNTQGWQTQITASNNDSLLFLQSLRYYDASDGHERYSGEIGQEEWRNGQDDNQSRAFTYDQLGRITSAIRGTSSLLSDTGITYDRNGNILTACRTGEQVSAFDSLAYSYSGDKLVSLSSHVATGGVPTSSNYTFSYDDNGNLTSDSRKGIAVSWNPLGLPETVTGASSPASIKAYYQYLTDGTKLSVTQPVSTVTNAGYVYLGSFVYSKYGNNYSFEGTDFGGGRILGASGPQYFTRDHLGNVRMVTNTSGIVQERNDYYLFGERQPSTSTLSSNRYRYAGKERQIMDSIGWLDFGARMYDSYLGRWISTDPMMEKYPAMGPYVYCANDPMNRVDPEGKDIYRYDKSTGAMFLFERTKDKFDQIGVFGQNSKTGEYYLKKKRDGSARIRIDKIEKGILAEGMNMYSDNRIDLGTEGNRPTIQGVQDFLLDFSNMIDREVGGYYVSLKGEDSIKYITIGNISRNTPQKAYPGSPYKALSSLPDYNPNQYDIKINYHTHLSRFSDSDRLHPSSLGEDRGDIGFKERQLEINPLMRFLIITNPTPFYY